jgi:hypothetical protein
MRSIVILLFAALAGACGSRTMPGPEPAASAAPPTAARTRHPPPPSEVCRCLTICFVQNGRLRIENLRYNSSTGDTLTVDSLPISQLVPLTGEYASVAGWYVGGERITVRGRRYGMYGRPRVLGIDEVIRIDDYRGVSVFAEAADTASASRVVYLPTRPGCEFQPYATEEFEG